MYRKVRCQWQNCLSRTWPLLANLGLNGCTKTTTALRRLADIRVRFVLSSHVKFQTVILPDLATPPFPPRGRPQAPLEPFVYPCRPILILGPAAAAKPLLLLLSAATLVYAAFMAVAIWRSAGNYRGRHAWRWLAKGSVLCVALQVIAGVGAG